MRPDDVCTTEVSLALLALAVLLMGGSKLICCPPWLFSVLCLGSSIFERFRLQSPLKREPGIPFAGACARVARTLSRLDGDPGLSGNFGDLGEPGEAWDLTGEPGLLGTNAER